MYSRFRSSQPNRAAILARSTSSRSLSTLGQASVLAMGGAVYHTAMAGVQNSVPAASGISVPAVISGRLQTAAVPHDGPVLAIDTPGIFAVVGAVSRFAGHVLGPIPGPATDVTGVLTMPGAVGVLTYGASGDNLVRTRSDLGVPAGKCGRRCVFLRLPGVVQVAV